MHAAELRGSTTRETDSVVIEEKVADTDVAMNTLKELDVATIQVGKRKLDEGSSIDVDTITNTNHHRGGHNYQDDGYYYDDYNDDGYYYDDYRTHSLAHTYSLTHSLLLTHSLTHSMFVLIQYSHEYPLSTADLQCGLAVDPDPGVRTCLI